MTTAAVSAFKENTATVEAAEPVNGLARNKAHVLFSAHFAVALSVATLSPVGWGGDGSFVNVFERRGGTKTMCVPTLPVTTTVFPSLAFAPGSFQAEPARRCSRRTSLGGTTTRRLP
jgi:hypothetical protein